MLADGVGKAAFHLKPVVDRLADPLKRSSKLFMDKTSALVLDPERARRPKLDTTGCGPATSDLGAARIRPAGSTSTLPDARARLLKPSSPASTASCRWMAIPAISDSPSPPQGRRAPPEGALLGAGPTQTEGGLRPRRLRDRRRGPAPHRRVLRRRGRYPQHLARPAPVRPSGPHRVAGGGLRRLAAGATPQDLRQIPPGRKAGLDP